MSISKITNVTTDTISKTQKISPKKIINTISEHKSAAALGTITAGLVGLAIYSAAFIKPSLNPNLANVAQANPIEHPLTPEEIKKIEIENTLKEKEESLKNAQKQLESDKDQAEAIGKLLKIDGLIDKEYFEQEYYLLKDFIKIGEENVAQQKEDYNSALKTYQKQEKILTE